MKVLWTSNTLFPQMASHLGEPVPVINGWLFALADDLAKSGVKLIIVTASNELPAQNATIDGITYYIINSRKKITKYDKTLEPQWESLMAMEKPDLVHVHGTEYAPALALVNKFPKLNYVLSIQGLISVIERYYLAGISRKEILTNITLRDVLRGDTIPAAQRKFRKRGQEIELNYIKGIKNIIGRTQWDHDHIKAINPEASYHFCNESLRQPFYQSDKWRLDKKSNYSIFLSQAGYPIKGLHMVLKAAMLIKKQYPQLKIRVAGYDITKTDTTSDSLRLNGYGKYLKTLIKRYNLKDSIVFTGPLSAEEMIREYLNAHSFICPSSIENSPNSIGEAQLLGVPCIASYVGGVPDMIENESTGLLYRFEEYEMLAAAVMQVFSNDELAQKLSTNGKKVAGMRHNRELNTTRTLEIYRNIIKEG